LAEFRKRHRAAGARFATAATRKFELQSSQEIAMQTTPKVSNRTTEPTEDPVVGIPTHPLSAGAGAVAMAVATGAVVGTAAGPVGTAIGAVVGAVVGGLGGDAIASAVGEAQDATYWREHFVQRTHVKPGSSYEDYGPAFAYGESARQRHGDRDFDIVAVELGQDWMAVRGQSNLEWDDARPAARDAWVRSGNSLGNASQRS
jgi:hypothetical protein